MTNRASFGLLLLFLVSIGACRSSYSVAEPQISPSQNGRGFVFHAFDDSGHFEVLSQDSILVLGAPHGTFDKGTDEIVEALALSGRWSAIVAKGFRTPEKPYNVNRPTEGIGLPAKKELFSPGSARLFSEYMKHLLTLSQRERWLYVEIHGQRKVKNVEIATVGLKPEEALKIKEIFQTSLLNRPNIRNIEVKIEGVDKIRYTAAATKQFGVLTKVPTALHIELPLKLRAFQRDEVVTLLLESLKEIEKLISARDLH